jgi:hypothetical protein
VLHDADAQPAGQVGVPGEVADDRIRLGGLAQDLAADVERGLVAAGRGQRGADRVGLGAGGPGDLHVADGHER